MSSSVMLAHTALGEQISEATRGPCLPELEPLKLEKRMLVMSTREGYWAQVDLCGGGGGLAFALLKGERWERGGTNGVDVEVARVEQDGPVGVVGVDVLEGDVVDEAVAYVGACPAFETGSVLDM